MQYNDSPVIEYPDHRRGSELKCFHLLLLFAEIGTRLLMGGIVRLKKDQIDRLAERVLADLESSGTVSLKVDRKLALETIRTVIASDIKAEEDLETEAERILDQTLRATGGGTGIDRHKMLRMIKEKLAKERNVVL